ncbi:MAG: GWxTD domain-containing protein [Acidobacteriota bacterium]
MMIRKKIGLYTKLSCLFLLFFCILTGIIPAQGISSKKEVTKSLPEKYKEWLDFVSYIVSDTEKKVFLQLTDNRERDIFIESFWKRRDPTPGTPENEFMEEHKKRFDYANSFLGRSVTRPGWMTDMGRIYIILGPPVSKERFEGGYVYPAEVWYYHGDPKFGLPSYFGIVFYKKGGAGEYKLYDPAVDGPWSLLIDKSNLESTDYEEVYEKLREIEPTLALMSLSMVPGDIPYNYQPSPLNNIILANIYESPKKLVDVTYATNFLKYKSLVEVDYSANYITSKFNSVILKDEESGIYFLHYAIEPKVISIDYYEPKDQYYVNFEVVGSIKDEKEKNIFDFQKNFTLYIDNDQIERLRSNGIVIQDSVPIVPGKFNFISMLKNSISKEFSYNETSYNFQPDLESIPKISQPIIGYRIEDAKGASHFPFKEEDYRILFRVDNEFSLKENLYILFKLHNLNKTLWDKGKISIRIFEIGKEDKPISEKEITLRERLFRDSLFFKEEFSLSSLFPGFFRIKIYLFNELGVVIDVKEDRFTISNSEVLKEPFILMKVTPHEKKFIYYYILATQCRKFGLVDKAEDYFDKAFEINPKYEQGIKSFGYFLLENKKYEKLLKVIESFKKIERLNFDYFYLKGVALMELRNFKEAIEAFKEGNKIYNSDVRLLNSLASCYFRIGEKDKAKTVWEASLKINPNQENIKKLLKSL